MSPLIPASEPEFQTLSTVEPWLYSRVERRTARSTELRPDSLREPLRNGGAGLQDQLRPASASSHCGRHASIIAVITFLCRAWRFLRSFLLRLRFSPRPPDMAWLWC